MKDFIEVLIKHLVDKPDEVRINEIKGGTTVIYELHLGDGDIGKVIGKKGQTAHSIRTLLTAVSSKNGQRSFLEIIENHDSEKKNEQTQNPETEINTENPTLNII